MGRVLAADIGGTHIRTAIVDAGGDLHVGEKTEAGLSRAGTSGHAVSGILVDVLRRRLESDNSIRAVGIGFPGFFRGDSGIVAASPNIPSLHDFPLAEMIERELKLPTRVQNDGLCAAIGEHHFGAGKGRTNLLHITLGTGIGGGLILNDIPYTGENGMATEFGHLRVDSADHARSCGCGNRGCVEAYASATAIARRYREQTGKGGDALAIHALARHGDSTATAVLEEAGHYLGMAIAEVIKSLDIGTVSVSGGVTGAWDLLYPSLMTALDDGLIPPRKGRVAVMRSTLADNAGLLGAASLAQMAA